jgi:biotin transporter BioY
MAIIVEILLQPVLSGLDGGRAEWPTVGVVLAWLLAAAVLGALLHHLREPAGRARGERGTPRSIVPIATPRRPRSGALQRRPPGIVVNS